MSQAVIGWLIAIVVFIVAEAATVTLVSVWFIGGAVCALVAAILGAGLGVQLAVFLVVSAALLAFACPAARKKWAKKPERMNADRLVGETAMVTEPIDACFECLSYFRKSDEGCVALKDLDERAAEEVAAADAECRECKARNILIGAERNGEEAVDE